MRKIASIPIMILATAILWAQTAPVPDFHRHPSTVWALTHATIFTEPGNKIDDGTIVLRDGRIEAVGTKVKIPKDATVRDMTGLTIYPGFIESWLPIKAPEFKEKHTEHWNQYVHADRNAVDGFDPDIESVNTLRKAGFTTAQVVNEDGIINGQSGVVQLDKSGTVLLTQSAQVFQFKWGGWDSDDYPGSLLGCIALMRQTLYDAQWYGKAWATYQKYPDQNRVPEQNLSLKALDSDLNRSLPFAFMTTDEIFDLRAIKIANEFSLHLWLKGNGYEYRRLKAIAAAAPLVIASVNYPGKPDVADPYRALQYSTEQLKHWDMAPDNLEKMHEAGIVFTITSDGTESPDAFRENLVRSVERGLDKSVALAALTTVPAKAMGLDDRVGKIAPGLLADLVVVKGDYFAPNTPVEAVWVGGEEHRIEEPNVPELSGFWDLKSADFSGSFEISEKEKSITGKLKQPDTTLAARHFHQDGERISWTLADPDDANRIFAFTGYITESKGNGTYVTPEGQSQTWTAILTESKPVETKKHVPEKASDLTVNYPEGVYGRKTVLPPLQDVLIDNATIWTCGPEGVLKGWDMLIQNGKITRIAKAITAKSNKVMVIDGRGKHVTPGIIDAHSHSAASSINEGTHSVTAEVRIEDVLNSDAITIYRELAGGTTIADVLHGSANSIGGQNAIIKMRWGVPPDQLIYANAPPGLKFALGENVKQSNWGDDHTTRYPQTRMGVEEIIRDAFTAAQDYERKWENWESSSRYRKTHIPPRRDLELDALVEVLNGKREIQCHSYRQDEIEMLMRLTEEFGIRVANFHHVLEGYKVADQIAAHGAGATTFSDWWAYKYEVIDAIPYNGALMHDVGVNVSFNSDSDELARRLNLEAAKAVKYGGLSETDALDFVTINPAKQLKIDKWVGSLEVGKDGDFVVWSGPPLSTYSVCEQTWIDGRRYFSLDSKKQALAEDQTLRLKLIRKILKSDDHPGAKPKPNGDQDKHGYSCSDREFYGEGGVQ